MTQPQHYRVSLAKAIAHYQQGDLTAKGLLHFYLKIRIAPGWTMKKTAKEICDELGIGKTAFYSALSKLKAEGSINWSTPANTQFSISLPFRECGNDSANAESQFAIAESDSVNAENDSVNAESQFAIAENKSPEVPTGKVSSNSPYSSSNLLSTFISSLSSDGEREIFESFCLQAASSMPMQPTLISRWIEMNAKSLIEEYRLRVIDRKVILKDEFYEVNSNSGKSSGNSPIVENQAEHSPSAAVMDQCQCSQCSSAEEEEICW